MSYDRPNRIKYSFGVHDFGGSADETYSVFGPKGKKGRIWDYGVEGVIEIFNGGSVTPKIAIGSPADHDAYGDDLVLHALADNSATSIRILYDEIADAANFALYMLERDIAANAEVVVSCIVATGSPTGQGVPFVIIDWED
jgi:hypothetical protein